MIATGVAYRQLNAAGVQQLVGRGVHYGSATDAAATYGGRHVIVVGGANSAGQAALHLATHAEHVTMLVRGESLARAMSLNIIQRQLGHTNLGTTSIYVQGIDPGEILAAARARRAPMMSATAGLEL